ncbi:MAG: tetratricopeptide repeat protein, partial [Nitrospirae bacterium]|nr:tetratricopeptide repeat protein [Nitrospirota bacterium]
MAIDKSKIVENAQRYTARGQIEKAIEEWQKLLSLTPSDGNIYNTVGDLHLKKNSAKDAVEEYLKAADAFNKAGFVLKTIAVYKKIIKLIPERIDIYLKLADLNAERGLTSNAIEDYLRVARHYAKSGLIKETLDIYKKIADLDPTNVNIKLKLAEMYLKEGLKNEAAKEFLEIADVYYYKEQLKEAEEFYGQVLKIDPTNSTALKGLEKLNVSTKKPDVNSLLGEADSHIQAGRFNEAEGIVTELLKKDLQNPLFRQRLGYIYLGRSKFEEAFSEFRPIAEEYVRKDEFEKAEKIILDYLKADSAKVEAILLLAELYERSGNLDLSVSEYAKVIEYYLDKGSLAEASLANPIYQKIKELVPDSLEAERFRNIFEPAEVKPSGPEVVEAPVDVVHETEVVKPGVGAMATEEAVVVGKAGTQDSQTIEKIDAYFTEAEVYMKYGLTKNAIDQLEAIVDLEPANLKAHIQLKEIYRLEGKIEKAVSECIFLSGIYGQQGDFVNKISILDEASRLDPDNESVKEAMGKIEIEGEAPEALLERTQTDAVQPSIILTDGSQETRVIKEEEDRPSWVDQVIEEPIEAVKEEDNASNNLTEDLAEAEFYLQQGLVEDARNMYHKILEKYPDSDEARAKLAEFEVETEIEEGFREASAVDEPEAQTEIRPTEESTIGEPVGQVVSDEIVGELIQKEEAGSKGEEEEYFDLSEVLKEDLTAEKPEKSETKELDEELESIFQDFQKGVQKQFGEEDFETHYNLGIAYKEMGLVNEAIGEFQLSIKGPDYFFDSASMLAICFQEKGMYKSAIAQLEKAISDPRCDDKRSLAIKYDLGMLYEMA